MTPDHLVPEIAAAIFKIVTKDFPEGRHPDRPGTPQELQKEANIYVATALAVLNALIKIKSQYVKPEYQEFEADSPPPGSTSH